MTQNITIVSNFYKLISNKSEYRLNMFLSLASITSHEQKFLVPAQPRIFKEST